MSKARMTPDDTLKVMLARIQEWDTDMPGALFFDTDALSDYAVYAVKADSFIRKSPEAGLDHG